MVKMDAAGSARLVTPEALRIEKVGRAVDTTVNSGAGSRRWQVHGHDIALQWVRPDFDHRVLDTGDSLGELRRESFDGLDGYDRGVGVELKRCGWRRKVKAADAVCISGINGIVIGLDDADEGRFGDARHHVVTSTHIRLFQKQVRELTGKHA